MRETAILVPVFVLAAWTVLILVVVAARRLRSRLSPCRWRGDEFCRADYLFDASPQGLFDIRTEVLRRFKTNVQSDQASAVVFSWPLQIRIDQREASDPTPTHSNFEHLQRVNKRVDLSSRDLIAERDREDTCRAGEISPPDFVARARSKGRMENRLNHGLLRQPAGDRQSAVFQVGQSDTQCLQATESEAAIIWRDRQAKLFERVPHHFFEMLVLDRDRPQQEITMPANVLGQSLDTDIHSVRERIKQNSGGVSVIDGNRNTKRMRNLADGWNILNLHRHRPGTFRPNQGRVWTDQRSDVCPDQRIVGFNFNAKALEQIGCHLLVRAVCAVWHEGMAAGRAESEIHQGNSGLTTRYSEGVMSPLKLTNPRRKFHGGRGTIETIGVPVLLLFPIVPDVSLRVEQDCRTTVRWNCEGFEAGWCELLRLNETSTPMHEKHLIT